MSLEIFLIGAAAGVVATVIPVLLAKKHLFDQLEELQANYDKYRTKILTVERMLEVANRNNQQQTKTS